MKNHGFGNQQLQCLTRNPQSYKYVQCRDTCVIVKNKSFLLSILHISPQRIDGRGLYKLIVSGVN